MKIEKFVCGPLAANGYIIYQDKGGSAYIIDPGYKANLYKDFVFENELKVIGILLTHHHHDHAGEAVKLAAEFGVNIFAHRREEPFSKININEVFEGGEILDLDGESLEVILTPGHTAGGICLYSDKSKICFTGDTLFKIETGLVDLPGGSEDEMRDTMRNIIDKWPNELTVYPGHGDSGTMKFVRENNEEFIWYMDN